MGFSNSMVINYPREEVFYIFIRAAKRDFPKFREDNPIGCSVKKTVGSYSASSATMKIEITDFKKDELYQITSSAGDIKYYSTYKFESVGEDKTKITLTESYDKKGVFAWLNKNLQSILFRGRVRKRFQYLIESLESELEKRRENIKKNSIEE